MEKAEKYICASCGKEHEGWPALTNNSPVYYYDLSDEDKQNIAQLSSDFCIIKHPDETNRFIRCYLILKVNDHCSNLEYGLWVSLSDKSFQDYNDHYNDDNYETTYFGWLSNALNDYPDTTRIPVNVVVRPGLSRPEIIPHDNHEHPFVQDYYNGISKTEAERRINNLLRNNATISPSIKTKQSWWKDLLGLK